VIKLNQNLVVSQLREMEGSIYWDMVSKARKLKNVLTLLGGDPDFVTPKHIVDTAINALKEGKTHYPPTPGIPELRQAIAKYNWKYGIDWKASEVIVTSGSGIALYMAMKGTLTPGEEVIVLDPYFMAYHDLINYFGAKEVPVSLEEDSGYHLNIENLTEKITSKTKMIILCTPNNPTGTVFNKKELTGIADLAKDNDLLVISDEVYNEYIWDENIHQSISNLPGMKERTIICNSFSKTFAMTGWRLGYLIADEPIANLLAKIPVGYRPATFIQLAGIKALKGTWIPMNKMKHEYDTRRQYLVKRLNEINGLSCPMPEGAFYLFPNIEETGQKSIPFCEGLLEEKKIGIVPGLACGNNGEDHVRIPLVKPMEELTKFADGIEEYISKQIS